MLRTLDVDSADGRFYSGGGARDAYRWMRTNQPAFRDRSGLVAAASYQSVIDAERNPRLVSDTGGIRPRHPSMQYMIDMGDAEYLLRRRLVTAGSRCKREREKASSIVRLCDAPIDAACESGECSESMPVVFTQSKPIPK